MTEPRRWIETDDAPAEVLALLKSARPTRPLDERARERSRRRISALSVVPAAAGVAVWLQHAAYGAVLGAAVSSAVAVAPRLLSGGGPDTAPGPARTEPRAPSTAVPVPLTSRETPSALPLGEPAPQRSTPTARFESGEHELSREARSLEHARTLVSLRPAEALAALRRHRAEFPRGTLEIECEFLEVEAYMRLGRRGEAEASARVLREHAPGSLYERRLDRLLMNGPPP
jgi:hypothetical protein